MPLFPPEPEEARLQREAREARYKLAQEQKAKDQKRYADIEDQVRLGQDVEKEDLLWLIKKKDEQTDYWRSLESQRVDEMNQTALRRRQWM